MKFTTAYLAWGALLLNHQDASVDAFQQSSAGYLNSLTRTSFSKPKSTPIRGYLDSLVKTDTAAAAATDQDTASSEAAEKIKAMEERLVANRELEEITPKLEEEEVTEQLHTAGITERIMRKIPMEGQASGAGGASTWDSFVKMEENWSKLKASKAFHYDSKLLRKDQNGVPPPPQFVTEDGAFGSPRCWAKLQESQNKELDYDIVVIGGTRLFFAQSFN
jgi:hypothetical protein